jgi:hypothetical protein
VIGKTVKGSRSGLDAPAAFRPSHSSEETSTFYARMDRRRKSASGKDGYYNRPERSRR